jgi:hypothetical protein
MSKEDAHIVGTTESNFTFTIDFGTIVKASLRVPGQPDQDLPHSEQEITVLSLPVGDSKVQLVIVWGPGDSDATVDLGTVTSGSVRLNVPAVIILGTNPFFVRLFGE